MRKVTMLSLVFLLFLSCNKSSIIEGVGYVGKNTGTSNLIIEQGTLTIYASSSSCTNIRITIDDVYRGTINPTTNNIPCGTVNQNAVSIRLKVGTHTYSAIGNSFGRPCNYLKTTVVIKKGLCQLIELS